MPTSGAAVLATWYDLPIEHRMSYLDWLHGSYLPEMLKRPGYLWAAHYRTLSDEALAAGDTHSSSYVFEADGRIRQPSFHNVTASITWTDPSDRYSLRLWGKNLAKENIMAIVSTNSSTVFTPGEPRRYGITASAKF